MRGAAQSADLCWINAYSGFSGPNGSPGAPWIRETRGPCIGQSPRVATPQRLIKRNDHPKNSSSYLSSTGAGSTDPMEVM